VTSPPRAPEITNVYEEVVDVDKRRRHGTGPAGEHYVETDDVVVVQGRPQERIEMKKEAGIVER